MAVRDAASSGSEGALGTPDCGRLRAINCTEPNGFSGGRGAPGSSGGSGRVLDVVGGTGGVAVGLKARPVGGRGRVGGVAAVAAPGGPDEGLIMEEPGAIKLASGLALDGFYKETEYRCSSLLDDGAVAYCSLLEWLWLRRLTRQRGRGLRL